jgi:hydrogenase maturation protease
VIEADEDSVQGSIEDGDTLNPHGMDPKTMLRFVKSIGAWPGKVVVIACEPQVVEEIGFKLSESVAGAVEPAVELVLKTIAELQSDAAYQAAE